MKEGVWGRHTGSCPRVLVYKIACATLYQNGDITWIEVQETNLKKVKK